MDKHAGTPANLVILGGGFGGIACARELAKLLHRYGLTREFLPILVDRQPGQLYHPILYEVATAAPPDASALELKRAAVVPYEEILAGTDARFVQTEVTGVDLERRMVKTNSEPLLPFTHLVLALGAEPNFFGIPGMTEHAFAFRSFNEIVRLRNRVAERLAAGARLPVAVCGGGSAGVEIAAELVGLWRKLGRKHPDVLLIEACPTILTGFPEATVRAATRRLAALGVTVRTNTRVTVADDTGLALTAADGTNERIETLVTIWTGGIKPNRLLEAMLVPHAGRGGAAVAETLLAAPGVWAIGDNICLIDPETKKPLPATARIAIEQGKHAARNIVRRIRGIPALPYPIRRYPYVIPVGGKWAIADFIAFNVTGFTGWCVKQAIELYYLSTILPVLRAAAMWFRGVTIYIQND